HMNCVLHKKQEPLIEDLTIGIKKMIYAFIAILIQSCIIFACTMLFFGIQFVLFQNKLLFINHPIDIVLTGIIFILQFALITYIATLFLFLTPLIVTENKSILGALQRSMKLVWNHWWRVFSVQITPWICYAFALLLIKSVGINIYLFANTSSDQIATIIIDLVMLALFIPWVAALLLIQLNDLKMREKLQK
ncbi:MAG: hypothetical protein JO149_04640, partial [Gammaproteobacteria bacterium]|nr:hypothetical protein [Gammaproteobacteria bacterium]